MGEQIEEYNYKEKEEAELDSVRFFNSYTTSTHQQRGE